MVVNSEGEEDIFCMHKFFGLDFYFESKGEEGYVNTDFNIENSPFCEVLPIHYLLTDILFLLSQSKSSGK